MNKRILVILGHPAQDSLCGALAQAYVKGAEAAGHEVRSLALGSLRFDPILREGYNCIQPLEPDLLAAQEAITWAQHLVFVYPIWWGSIPALLKGFFDRVLLPGFAFRFRKDSLMADGLLTPYLDIPFQHASPKVLKAMKRPANEARVLERLKAWRETCPEIAVRSTKLTVFTSTRMNST